LNSIFSLERTLPDRSVCKILAAKRARSSNIDHFHLVDVKKPRPIDLKYYTNDQRGYDNKNVLSYKVFLVRHFFLSDDFPVDVRERLGDLVFLALRTFLQDKFKEEELKEWMNDITQEERDDVRVLISDLFDYLPEFPRELVSD
jgi:hypothetical protein